MTVLTPLALAVALAAAPAEGAASAPAPAEPQLVDATDVVPGLVLDIRYATEDNFLKRKLYDAPRCLLRPSVARRLAQVAKALEPQGFRLKAWDCYRPFSVQEALWKAMPVRGLVAPPSRGGSHHNRGAAVDVTLVRVDGSPVEMPTDHDEFSKAAWRNSELPSAEAKRHRKILQDAMIAAGFVPTRMEWWHFHDPDARRFETLDEPLVPREEPDEAPAPGRAGAE